MTKRQTIRNVALYATLVAYGAFMLLPVAWAIFSSLKPLHEVYTFPPSFWTPHPRWANYTDAATRLPLFRFIANSLFISSCSVVGAVLTSSMAGYVLARVRFRGRRVCFVLLIITLVVPAQVLLVPQFLMFDMLGWVNTYKPLIVPAWLGGGAFNVFLFRQFFRTLPLEMEDAARLDGAGLSQTYWHVLLPAVRPATVTVALLSFVYHWQSFLDPLLYLSDFMTFPVSLGLRMYQSMAGTWANLLMAASLIALVPVVIVFLLAERHIMRGLGVVGRLPYGRMSDRNRRGSG